MNIYCERKNILQAYIFVLGIILITSICFSIIFYIFPLKKELLTVFANLTLSLAVFSGAYYQASNMPFLKITPIIILPVMIIITYWVMTFFFAEPSISLLAKKSIAILFADICGVFFSRF